jgi:hypothetical protein
MPSEHDVYRWGLWEEIRVILNWASREELCD